MVDLLLRKLQQFFEEHAIEGYLVGGSLRDLLLGERPQDLDFAVRGDPEPVARALANELKGNYVPLSQEKGVKRVLLPKKPYGRIIIDFAPLHGESIADDLAQRDFTVNALALSTAALTTLVAFHPQSGQPPAHLIDPFDGWRDLHAKALRVVQERVFQKDPLRLLRAIRLSANRQLPIEPSTSSILSRDALLLVQVAPERIRDELLHMLAAPHVTTAIRILDTYDLLPLIFPAFFAADHSPTFSTSTEPGGNNWPTLTSIATILSASQGGTASPSQAEQQLLAPLVRLSHRPAFKKRWKKAPARACTRSEALLLAALLADLLPEVQEQPIAAALMRLTLGRQTTAFILFLLQHNAAPWSVEARPPTDSEPWRAARHYYERFGERGIDLAAFCLARQLASIKSAAPDAAWQDQAQTLLHLITGYYEEYNALLPPTLLDGEVLIARLGVAKGPIIGALLTRVRNAQLDGLVRTRAQALQFLAEQTGIFVKASAGQTEPGGQKQHLLEKPAGE